MANKEGFGVLFINGAKKSDKSPDYTGSININGQEIKLSCWNATSPKGVSYLQVRVNDFKPAAKEEKPKEQMDFDCPDFEDDFSPF